MELRETCALGSRELFGQLSVADVSTIQLCLNTADKRLVKTVGCVGACLRHHRSKGLTRSTKRLRDRLSWETAR